MLTAAKLTSPMLAPARLHVPWPSSTVAVPHAAPCKHESHPGGLETQAVVARDAGHVTLLRTRWVGLESSHSLPTGPD